jgi:hypothetical protein
VRVHVCVCACMGVGVRVHVCVCACMGVGVRVHVCVWGGRACMCVSLQNFQTQT